MQPFEHAPDFAANETSGKLEIGPYETLYQELFAEAIADGVITEEERAELERVAGSLGLTAERLEVLESALSQSYEARHGKQIAGHARPSLLPPPTESVASLKKQITALEEKVRSLSLELERALS